MSLDLSSPVYISSVLTTDTLIVDTSLYVAQDAVVDAAIVHMRKDVTSENTLLPLESVGLTDFTGYGLNYAAVELLPLEIDAPALYGGRITLEALLSAGWEGVRGEAYTEFLPLESRGGGRKFTPAPNIGAAELIPLSAVATCLVGEIGRGEVSFAVMEGLASDYSFNHAEVELLPLRALGSAYRIPMSAADGFAAAEDALALLDQFMRLSDGATFSTEVTATLVHFLQDLVRIVETGTALRHRKGAVVDGVAILDQAKRIVSAAMTEALSLSDTFMLDRLRTRLEEQIVGSDRWLHRSFASLIEDFVATDTLIRQFPSLLDEMVQVQDQGLTRFAMVLSDAAWMDDAEVSMRRLKAQASDELRAEDSVQGLRTLLALLTDRVSFVGALQFGDEVYDAWVVNTHTLGLSRYTGYAFNSVGGGFGVRSDGIYRLEGADDAGTAIPAWLETGLLDFGSAHKKQVPEAFLGVANDGRLLLKVTTSQDGKLVEDWYEATVVNEAADNTRCKIGRGLKARYWKFRLENVRGSDFELESLEIRPVVLERRL